MNDVYMEHELSIAQNTKGAGLRLLGRITFQKLFHPPFGVLFTFPSRYYPLLISAHI